MNKDTPEQKIVKREIITDQSDPRMIEFRKSNGEFAPGFPRKTVRLEITEYAPDKNNPKITTHFSFYEGERPPGWNEFWGKLLMDWYEKASENDKREKAGFTVYKESDFLSGNYENTWQNKIFFDRKVLKNIAEDAKLHNDIENVRSSAAACVNVLGNIAKKPKDLINFLNTFGMGVQEIIPFPTGVIFGGYKYNDAGNVVFEWIGPKVSPLHERGGRGHNRTSIDAFILAKVDNKVTQIFVEWKFTEKYNSDGNLNKFSGIAGNERLRRYSTCLAELRKRKQFPFKMTNEKGIGLYDLGYEPFYQLARMTLLAKLTKDSEFDNGLKIENYKILHLSHSANEALNLISKDHLKFCPGLQSCVGKPLQEAWKDSVLSPSESKQFHYGYWDQGLKFLPGGDLKQYLVSRYVGAQTSQPLV